MGIAAPSDVDPRQGFFDMGMDSLMAVELRNRLEALTGKPLHASVIFNYSSVAALAGHIGFGLEGMEAPGQSIRAQEPDADEVTQALADISDAEAEKLLMQELATMEEKEIG